MKILHVMAGAKTGGAETAFVELCIAQKQSGITVHAACRPNPRNEAMRAQGVHVTELPFGGVFDFKTTPALKKLIENVEPAAIVTWMNRAAKKLPKNLPCTWIARLGGYYDLKYYKGVDHFVVNAPDIGRWMQEKGTPTQKITFIPNFALTPTHVTPTPRASLDTPDNAFIFLTLARLHTNKAIDTLLSALALVPEAILWIGGDGPERAKLEAQAQTLGLTPRVRFLGWRDDRWALLAACNAFVFPSRHEPFGNSFMQCWAAGRALITTASQGPSHYVTNEQDALLTPIDDVKAMATAMNRLRQNPELCAKLAKAGQARYAQAFDKDTILKQWHSLLQQRPQ